MLTPAQPAHFVGIDTSNSGLLYTFTAGSASTTTYDENAWTATEDCWVVGSLTHNRNPMSNNTSYVKIDNQPVAACGTFIADGDSYVGVCAPVKKGQIVTAHTKKGTIGSVCIRKCLY